MSTTENITYFVLARAKGDWEPQGTTGDMQTALAAARELLKSRRFAAVKVDKQFLDGTNQRFVTATIFQEKRQTGFSLLALILLALVGGCISFAVTYLVVTKLS